MNKCVHTEHCCIEHGCKYGNDNCPVWLGSKKQSYPCEYCYPPEYWQGEENFDIKSVQIPSVSIDEMNERVNKFENEYVLGEPTTIENLRKIGKNRGNNEN